MAVSVVADTAMEADAWATALLVLGPERGYSLAQARGLAALLVRASGYTFDVRVTDALRCPIQAIEPSGAINMDEYHNDANVCPPLVYEAKRKRELAGKG